MWRREESIGQWFSDRRLPDKPFLVQWLRKKIPAGFGSWPFPDAVKESSLSFNANIGSVGVMLSVTVGVLDGLEALGTARDDDQGASCEFNKSMGLTKSIDMLGIPVIRILGLPNGQGARIQRKSVAIVPNFRYLPTNIRIPAVQTPEMYRSCASDIMDGKRFLDLTSGVRTLTSRFANHPHIRASLNINSLPDPERESFLREAEILKGIPADRAELVAVFRHIPIEMISRLRFLAKRRVILYTLCREPRRIHTRVHDLAAVRDKANAEIHLIPHRTKYRAVSRN